MGIIQEFLAYLLRLFLCGIYPMVDIYGYFVFCGIFCFESNITNSFGSATFFAIYNFLIMVKIIFYLELLIPRSPSIVELFSQIDRDQTVPIFANINPFVADSMDAKSTHTSAICKICKTFKPPRAHHCSVTDRCYLKYDHHNRIFDTVIGFHNYKTFYQVIVLQMVSVTFFIILIALELFMSSSLETINKVNYIIALVLYIIFATINLKSLIFHTYLICHNETTIEYHAINAYMRGDHTWNHAFQEGPIKRNQPVTTRVQLNPYNIGVMNNWYEVFGRSILGWFTTDFTSPSTGATFRTNEIEGNEDCFYDIL